MKQGQRLGPYEILGPLGAGGMGEVWRAEDTKLGRQVALKVLPDEFAADADRMARFEREARVLASLNHSNIAHLYGLESSPVIPSAAEGRVEGPVRLAGLPQGKPVRLASLVQDKPVRLAGLPQGKPVRLAGLPQGKPGRGSGVVDAPPHPDPSTPVSPRDTSAQDDSEAGSASAALAERHPDRGAEQSETPSGGVPRPAPSDSSALTFLVMELVEGEDLSDRIAHGPVAIDEAIPIALQIADALEAAHEQGIVHRDLKPANIKLTEDGQVKVLDFGLAKAWEEEGGDTGLSLSPTMTRHATAAGVILGTAAYMSPEQARGKRVDRRADIWAYGVVLWEMLTGRKLFEGETVSDVMAAVLTRSPDLAALPEETPQSMRLVVRRCLERDPRQRLQWIGDARLELTSTDKREGPDVEIGPVAGRRPRTPWLIAAAAGVIAVGMAAWSVLRPVPPAPVVAGSILPPESHQFLFFDGFSGSISVSPNGRWITFSAAVGDEPASLWLRPVGSVESRPIEGTEDGSFPFWSPDSHQIAFFAGGKLKRVALDGSPAVTLCDAPNGRSGGWNRDGVILFSPSPQDPIYRIPAGGGEPEPVTELDFDANETTHRWATFLPDGRHFLFLAGSHSEGIHSGVNGVWVGELGSTDRRLLIHARTNAAYASGYLLYVREDVLLAHPFDPDRQELAGDPIPVVSGIGVDLPYYRADFAVSDTGVLTYRLGSVHGEVQLHEATIGGEIGEPVGAPARILAVALSPEGQRAALVISDPESGTDDVWIQDLSRDLRSRLTFGTLDEGSPVWSPDGRRIAFAEYARTGETEIKVVEVDGAGEPELILTSKQDVNLVDWSPDGRWLLANTVPGDDPSQRDIIALPLDGGEPVSVIATKFPEMAQDLSPDGRWLLYVSLASGARELFVTPFPKPGRRWQVAGRDVFGGSWNRPDEIFYVSPGPRTAVIPVRAGGDWIEFGQPVQYPPQKNVTAGSIHADGRHALLAVRPDAEESLPIIFMTNWAAPLKDR